MIALVLAALLVAPLPPPKEPEPDSLTAWKNETLCYDRDVSCRPRVVNLGEWNPIPLP